MPTSPWKAVLEAVQHLERGRGCTLPEVVRYLKRQEPTKTSRKTLAWCVRTQPLVPEDGRAARGGIAQLPCVSARRGKSHRRRPISRRRASRKPARCSSRKHARRSSRYLGSGCNLTDFPMHWTHETVQDYKKSVQSNMEYYTGKMFADAYKTTMARGVRRVSDES